MDNPNDGLHRARWAAEEAAKKAAILNKQMAPLRAQLDALSNSPQLARLAKNTAKMEQTFAGVKQLEGPSRKVADSLRRAVEGQQRGYLTTPPPVPRDYTYDKMVEITERVTQLTDAQTDRADAEHARAEAESSARERAEKRSRWMLLVSVASIVVTILIGVASHLFN